MPDAPGRYDQTQINHRHYSDLAYLLALELEGAGTLIDVGANIGTIALPVAVAGSSVVAIEMVPGNYLRLLLASLVNQVTRFLPINAAASSFDGTVHFAGGEAWAWIVQHEGHEAVCLRLDTILASVSRHTPSLLRSPFGLKIDVEGHEYDVLLGAQRFLAEHRPLVLFESLQLDYFLEKTELCKRMLVAAGYSLFMLHDNLLVPKPLNHVQEELVGDFVAVPIERVASMHERFPAFQIRQPTAEERLRWLEVLFRDTPDHQKHALKVIDLIGREDPAFAEASADLRVRIQTALELARPSEAPRV